MPTAVHRPATKASRTRLARRLAATAGAVGATASATTTEAALVYVPTSGVAAAQNIPGFSFTPPTTVVTGALSPPTTLGGGTTNWDIDGAGSSADFVLSHSNGGDTIRAALIPGGPGGRPSGLILTNSSTLIRAEATNPAAIIGSNLTGAAWNTEAQPMTQSIAQFTLRTNRQPNFPNTTSKQFGFRFSTPDATAWYYGWGTLEIDLTRPAGSGYTISEAFYQTTPGSPITVGAVPVPEPAGLALLALGATGLAAWRARRS